MNTRRRSSDSFGERPRPAAMVRFHTLSDTLYLAEQHERSRIPRQQNMREVDLTSDPMSWEPMIRTTSTVPPPATKASIEKSPDVEIVQEEELQQMSECAICLVEFQVREKAKETPGKHCYHSNCINRPGVRDT
ncbi:hypothetical protein H5410_009469 [Solanum commersonii]|uniref:RING-type E3 ubiquitin transferase n=1 Tax=Solanum commersonii TaxID=4109 RepID=A0A9J6AIU8_SOLCO|nr:hypothetical protein H5410_009469 [Solanum commersonii]